MMGAYEREREDMSLSRSSISKLVRLRQKLRFQQNGKEILRLVKIEEFLAITNMKRFGN